MRKKTELKLALIRLKNDLVLHSDRGVGLLWADASFFFSNLSSLCIYQLIRENEMWQKVIF